jgi:hypothetical protein
VQGGYDPYGASAQQGPYRQHALPVQPKAIAWPTFVCLGVLGLGFLLLIGTGVAAYGSESDGVMMSYVAVGPFMFGLVGSIVALMTRRSSPGKAIGAPLGCGCGAALGSFMALVVFMAVIWRML